MSSNDSGPVGGEPPFASVNLAPAEIKKAAATARLIQPALEGWIGSYGLARKLSVESLALTVAAAAPFAPANSIVKMAEVGLFVVLLDDALDDVSLNSDEVGERANAYKSILDGERQEHVGNGEAVGRAIVDIAAGLEGYRLFEDLRGEWRQAVRLMIDGMLFEREAGRRPCCEAYSLPSFSEYMLHGVHSIGVPSYAVTGAIVLGDESILLQWGQFRELAEAAGFCIRLANDLATHRRELREPKITAIDVILAEAGAGRSGDEIEAAAQAAEQRLQEERRRGLERCHELAHQVSSSSGQPEAFVCNLAEVVCHFYGLGDY